MKKVSKEMNVPSTDNKNAFPFATCFALHTVTKTFCTILKLSLDFPGPVNKQNEKIVSVVDTVVRTEHNSPKELELLKKES